MLSGALLLVVGKLVAVKAAFRETNDSAAHQAPTTPQTVQ